MQPSYQDNFHQTFTSLAPMMDYHRCQADKTRWSRMPVHTLHVVPLEREDLTPDMCQVFEKTVSKQAIEDTVKNLGLAANTPAGMFPLRNTAYNSLLERAKIHGNVLKRLSRPELAHVLNLCLQKHSSDALVLIRDEKISAVLGGDNSDYSVLPIDALMDAVKEHLEDRFPGYRFAGGYTDHSITTATWTLDGQRKALLKSYDAALVAHGKKAEAGKYIPAIRFVTSDIGAASASVSALLMGNDRELYIGDVLSVAHKRQSTIQEFKNHLPMLMAQFDDVVSKLEALLDVYLNYPVDAMLSLYKKFKLPKKQSLMAIEFFEQINAGMAATAYDVWMALQEIPFLLRSEKAPKSKIINVEESIARCLSVKWEDYDLPRAGE